MTDSTRILGTGPDIRTGFDIGTYTLHCSGCGMAIEDYRLLGFNCGPITEKLETCRVRHPIKQAFCGECTGEPHAALPETFHLVAVYSQQHLDQQANYRAVLAERMVQLQPTSSRAIQEDPIIQEIQRALAQLEATGLPRRFRLDPI